MFGLLIGVVVAAMIGGGLYAAVRASPSRAITPVCQATTPAGTASLDVDQATNATTIAAVGKRLGMPDHAVTIALAAALQESRLHNLNYGDRDSLGLFQQRPSQGWGTPAQILVPASAAASFYQHLGRVSGWQSLSVADAAQSVQHSASRDAYAQWETPARAIAEALTGEVPAGFACHLLATPTRALAPGLTATMTSELGAPGLGVAVTPAQGWTMASWLVGHATKYGITAVTFNGQRWTPKSGVWKPEATITTATTGVEITPPPVA